MYHPRHLETFNCNSDTPPKEKKKRKERNNPKLHNDFRPIAFTSLVMKTLEKITKFLILAVTECNLDPLQFAYRSGRGVDDAKLFILNTMCRHHMDH